MKHVSITIIPVSRNNKLNGNIEKILTLFNYRQTYLAALILYCFIMSFYQIIFLNILITLIFLASYNYIKYRSIAKAISISRKTNETIVKQGTNLKVTYQIYNHSNFTCPTISITDKYSGTVKEFTGTDTPRPIESRSTLIINHEVICNSGTGDKFFEEIDIRFSDPFGFFTFSVRFKQRSKITVYPAIQDLIPFSLAPQADSIDFGLYDISKSGDALNFVGVREYRTGDPIKRVNWKLSQKREELIVNEFERNVNASVSIFIDLHKSLHCGSGSNSTWEYAKDIALSIASKNSSNYNEVNILTNDKLFDNKNNKRDLLFLELSISKCEIKLDKHYDTVLDRIIHNIPHGTNYFHITPLISTSHFFKAKDQLLRIRDKVSSFTLIAINPQQVLEDFLSKQETFGSNINNNHITTWQENVLPILRKYGIDVYFVEIDRNNKLIDSFKRKGYPFEAN